MATPSSNHANLVALCACKMGASLWRNNCGKAVYSRLGPQGVYWADAPITVRLMPGDVVIRQGERVAYGVGVGGSDHIGFTPVPVLTRVFPVFTAIESKYGTGRLAASQKIFLSGVARMGGLAIVARNPNATAALVGSVAGGDINLLGKVHEA